MTTIAKIKDNPGLVKDLVTGAVINVDDYKYQEHKKIMSISRRNMAEKSAMTYSIEHMNGEINNLKQDVDSIKQMLQILIDRKE
jgi:hypothetical protein